MVRDVFRMARENAPSIIFIDEVDAIATKRFDAQTGADREVQRILLELLNQMDGFDQGSNVKVCIVKRGVGASFYGKQAGSEISCVQIEADFACCRSRRSSWLPTDKTRLTQLSYVPVDWIGRSSSLGLRDESEG